MEGPSSDFSFSDVDNNVEIDDRPTVLDDLGVDPNAPNQNLNTFLQDNLVAGPSEESIKFEQQYYRLQGVGDDPLLEEAKHALDSPPAQTQLAVRPQPLDRAKPKKMRATKFDMKVNRTILGLLGFSSSNQNKQKIMDKLQGNICLLLYSQDPSIDFTVEVEVEGMLPETIQKNVDSWWGRAQGQMKKEMANSKSDSSEVASEFSFDNHRVQKQQMKPEMLPSLSRQESAQHDQEVRQKIHDEIMNAIMHKKQTNQDPGFSDEGQQAAMDMDSKGLKLKHRNFKGTN